MITWVYGSIRFLNPSNLSWGYMVAGAYASHCQTRVHPGWCASPVHCIVSIQSAQQNSPYTDLITHFSPSAGITGE